MDYTAWPKGVDPARWLLGACSAGDPLRAAVVATYAELDHTRDQRDDAERQVVVVTRDRDKTCVELDAARARLDRVRTICRDRYFLAQGGERAVFVDEVLAELPTTEG